MDGSLNNGDISPAQGDGFYQTLRDETPMEISQTGGIEPAEDILYGDNDNEGGSGSPSIPHPFELVKVAADTLCVRLGAIKRVKATINSTELNIDHTQNELSIPSSGTRDYWLDITLQSGDITAVAVTNSVPAANSENQARLFLGSVETNNGEISFLYSNLSGSQDHFSCGKKHFFGVL